MIMKIFIKSFLLGLVSIVALWGTTITANAQDPGGTIPSASVPAIVERIFGEVFGKKITPAESTYWKSRARTDKKTESALKGAMYFQKAKGLTMPKTAVPKSAAKTTITPSTPLVSNPISILDGEAILIAHDGTYLGLISSNQYDSQSIINPYGSYGSKYASKSIMNQYGSYGGEYASKSPFNKYTSTPPRIYLDNQFIGYLTVNAYKASAINTYSLIGYLQSH